ncbi:hypothetical protein B0T21DRAFT_406877 [Apiosordaria backusii]|uniref:BHLH domain-containing protein n=1 Tax=Apiosordaria backusii TaxID=314023 RepID=A0AA40K7L5_9PEZI|nr:hypothetical protein B0T21DRAFT_406877 [Apiosordaria backusii]
MEQTPRWVQSDPTQISESQFELGLSSVFELQISTDSRTWAYNEFPHGNTGYHEPSLNHGVSIPVDQAPYQQPIEDNRLPSPVYPPSVAAFHPASSAIQGGWAPNSPLSPTGPYGDVACALSSASSVQASPIINHWASGSFPINHAYEGLSMSQPNSPVVSVEFDAPHPRQGISEPYCTGSLLLDTASPLGHELNTTTLLPPTIQIEIQTTSSRRRRPSRKATASNVRRTTRPAGKGQQPSASIKTKPASKARDNKKDSPTSSSSLQPQQQQQQTKANGPSLRTATRRCKRTADETLPKPGESVEDQRARENHNQVEKEYRERLHKGFEQLLEALYALPVEELMTARCQIQATEGMSREHTDDDEQIAIIQALLDERASLGLPVRTGTGSKGKKKQRRMSKAEVLHYTCRVLKSMGDGNQKLKEEVEELRMLHDKNLKEGRK